MTAGEFEGAQRAKPRSVTVQWGLLAVGLAALGYFAIWPIMAVRLGYTFAAGQMPRCDAPFTTGLLLSTINGSPAAHMFGLAVSEVSAASLVRSDDSGIACRAQIMSNIGRRTVNYTVRWDGAAKDRVILEAQPWWQ